MSEDEKDLSVNNIEPESDAADTETKQEQQRMKIDPDTLPKDTVHCYPANPAIILRRRIVCGILAALSIPGTVYFLLPASRNILVAVLFVIIFVISVIVFLHTFLIANYRVAVDYNEKKIILRYQFQKINIDFANFETRDGKPDKADELRGLTTKSNAGVQYLVLDDVKASACYQTTTRDLAGLDDFLSLKKDAVEVQSAYRGSIIESKPIDSDDEIDKIIKNATT